MAKKILLADDSITIQKVIELTFSDEDFDVITVGNGRLALERLPEVRPDIVLCDIIMPEKDGYEVCEQIKSNPAWAQIPVLLLTGAFEPFDQERASRAGYDGSLAKPFEPETLVAKVKDLLAKAPRPLAPPPLPPLARAAASAVAAPSAPPPPPPPAPPRSGPGTTPVSASFIPDEPFSGLDAGAFVAEPASATDTGAISTTSPSLAPISAAESETLRSGVQGEESATVMFRPSETPWAATPTPAAPTFEAASTTGRLPAVERSAAEEPAAFEAVLEEDLDFGPGEYVAEPRGGAERSITERPEAAYEVTTLPPVSPIEEGASGPFAALVRGGPVPVASVDDASAETGAFAPTSVVPDEGVLEAQPAPELPEPPPRTLLEPPPPPRIEAPRPPAPSVPAARSLPPPEPSVIAQAGAARTLLEPAPAPPPRSPEPIAAPPKPTITAPAIASASAPPRRPEIVAPPPPPPPRPMREPAPAAAPPPSVAASAAAEPPSFAGILKSDEPPAPRPSEAAAVAVPVDMVDKIAQRVVAQVSEKVVREIAWEVIPDLAETLIKREIERLKAELAKL